MAYEWHSDFEDGQTRAACSKCGVPYRWPSELVKLDDGFYYCKRRCIEQTVKARDKIIAQSRKRREMPPPKFVQAPRYADDYAAAESQIFSFIMRAAPADNVGGASTLGGALIGATYLANLILEGRRPDTWIAAAKTKLAVCCNYLMAAQYGNASGPSPSTPPTDIRYGGVFDSSGSNAGNVAAAGIAFVKGYSALGNAAYLAAADMAAMHLRFLQCTDLFTSGGATYPSLGAPYHTGGISLTVASSGAFVFGQQVMQVSGSALKFFGLLAAVKGASAVYGVASSPSLTGSSQATLAVMQAECVAFMTVGAMDVAVGGAVVNPFSIAAPKNFYAPFGTPGGDGTWHSAGDTVLLMSYVIEGLHETGNALGAVAAFFSWAMTFTSNPANVVGPNVDVGGNNKGIFDPHITMASSVSTVTMMESTGATYDYRWLAVTAAFQSANYQTQFKAAKDVLSTPGPSTRQLPDPRLRYIGRVGRSGLSFQVNLADSVSYAGQVGNIYRYAPQAFGDVYTNPSAASTIVPVSPSAPSGPAAPAAPAGLLATPGSTQVALSWTASPGATSYNVWRGTTPGGEGQVATGIAATSYTNTGLTNGTTYYFKVVAANAAGTSAFSSEVSATPQILAPLAPTGLSATRGDTQVLLSWTASSGATTYNIWRGTSPGGESQVVTGVGTTNYTNTGLTNGTTYYYKVLAVNAGGSSPLSSEVNATPTSSSVNQNLGINLEGTSDFEPMQMWADIMHQGRPWCVLDGFNNPTGTATTLDSNGWPMTDTGIVLGTTNPTSTILQGGVYKLSFTGQASSILTHNSSGGVTVTGISYNSGTNTTTADVTVATGNNLQLEFLGTKRLSTDSPGTGLTNVKLMRPGHLTTETFNQAFLARVAHFGLVRFMQYQGAGGQGINGNLNVNWSDRPLPSYATANRSDGGSIEHAILLSNANSSAMWVNIPIFATDDYITKMAQAILYGTDGTTPYTSVQMSPVYPPLNAGLNVYFEYVNEIWNGGYTSSWQNQSLALDEVTPTTWAATTAYHVANFSSVTNAVVRNDGGKRYVCITAGTSAGSGGPTGTAANITDGTVHWKYIDTPSGSADPFHYTYAGAVGGPVGSQYRQGRKLVEASNLFRAVFGNTAMGTRIRPVAAAQWGNDGTINFILNYVSAVYGPTNAFSNPLHAVNYYLYAIAGAPYITVSNESADGMTENQVISQMTSNMTSSLTVATDWNGIASGFGLKLTTYEGGAANSGGHSDTAKAAAQLDARMATDIIEPLINGFYAAGGEMFTYYTLCNVWNAGGGGAYFGLSTDITSEATAKWDAVIAVSLE